MQADAPRGHSIRANNGGRCQTRGWRAPEKRFSHRELSALGKAQTPERATDDLVGGRWPRLDRTKLRLAVDTRPVPIAHSPLDEPVLTLVGHVVSSLHRNIPRVGRS